MGRVAKQLSQRFKLCGLTLRADALKAKSGDNAVAQVAQASTGGRLGAFWPRTKTNAREGRGATAHRGFPR